MVSVSALNKIRMTEEFVTRGDECAMREEFFKKLYQNEDGNDTL